MSQTETSGGTFLYLLMAPDSNCTSRDQKSVPAQAYEPPPELMALNFLATFFSRHPPEQQPPYRFRCLLLVQFSSACALYVALSSLIHSLTPTYTAFHYQ